jgi:hypothetical protein
MAAEMAFKFGSEGQPARLIVPSVAVVEDDEGRFVFVVEETKEPGIGIVKRKSVRIGDLTDEGIEVYDGLEDGEKLVTAGVSKLTDGQKIKLLTAREN